MPNRLLKSVFYRGSKILAESDIYDRTDSCPVCLSKHKRKNVYKIQSHPEINLLKCDFCKAFSASHMPNDRYLKYLYSNYYPDENKPKVTIANVEKFAYHIIKYIQINNLDLINILDFGGGDGALSLKIADLIRKNHSNCKIYISLVDYHIPTYSPNDNISIYQSQDISQIDVKYNIVLASAVLEHIPEVNIVLKKLFSLVSPDGYFYARTPSIASFLKFLPNIDFTYPFYAHDMGSSFWNRVISTFNLDADIVVSQPSPVETSFLASPIRALLAYMLKFFAQIEIIFRRKKYIDLFWNFVGGWEIILHFRSIYKMQ